MFEWYHAIKSIDYMQIHKLVYRKGILNHLRTDAQTLIEMPIISTLFWKKTIDNQTKCLIMMLDISIYCDSNKCIYLHKFTSKRRRLWKRMCIIFYMYKAIFIGHTTLQASKPSTV